ncbi:MAG: peptidoglycan-binding protein [Actinomycetota bacterium]|nr:peptidoglycan-binding protein [Actinomycetota bacterium]
MTNDVHENAIDDDDDVVIRDLSRGDSGQDVEALQAILEKRGYTLGEDGVDGAFGRVTEAFVVHFQWRHGLNTDGVVGPRTRAALGLQARPPVTRGGEPVLSEIDNLELGLGEPLEDHADVELGEPVEDDEDEAAAGEPVDVDYKP